jgi:hypothetical protein
MIISPVQEREKGTPFHNPTYKLSNQTTPRYQGASGSSHSLTPLNPFKMVTVTACFDRQKKDGTTFAVLEISGGVELVLSQGSNRYYATVRKCTIPFTGSLEVGKMMIGQKIEGEIVRVIVEPYEYVNQRTGEVMRLQHSYAYRPKDSQDLIGHTRVDSMQMA